MIVGFYLEIEEQRRFDSDFEKSFSGNLLSENIVIETIREYIRKGNPINIKCGANIVADEKHNKDNYT